jgi:hypothetical protein
MKRMGDDGMAEGRGKFLEKNRRGGEVFIFQGFAKNKWLDLP